MQPAKPPRLMREVASRRGDAKPAELTGKDGQPLQPPMDMRETARHIAFIFAKAMHKAEEKGG